MQSGTVCRVGVLAAAAVLGSHARAGAQAARAGGEARQMFELTLRVARTSSWGLRGAPGASASILADIPRTRGAGVRLAYSTSSRVAVFVAGDATIYGDLSGFTTLVVGGAYRVPLARRLALSGSVGAGRVSHSSNVAFWSVAWGGEVRLEVLPRLALVVGAEALEPLGEARGGEATRSEVVGTPSRLTYGLMWSFGRPAR